MWQFKKNYDDNATTTGSSGNDLIINGEFFAKGGVKVSLSGGVGNDSIYNRGNNVTINAGTGNNYIYSSG